MLFSGTIRATVLRKNLTVETRTIAHSFTVQHKWLIFFLRLHFCIINIEQRNSFVSINSSTHKHFQMNSQLPNATQLRALISPIFIDRDRGCRSISQWWEADYTSTFNRDTDRLIWVEVGKRERKAVRIWNPPFMMLSSFIHFHSHCLSIFYYAKWISLEIIIRTFGSPSMNNAVGY